MQPLDSEDTDVTAQSVSDTAPVASDRARPVQRDVIAVIFDELKAVNTELWDIEDEIRELEARQDFGERFIALARKVYLTNDRRARIKHTINVTYGSDLIEEKSYAGS